MSHKNTIESLFKRFDVPDYMRFDTKNVDIINHYDFTELSSYDKYFFIASGESFYYIYYNISNIMYNSIKIEFCNKFNELNREGDFPCIYQRRINLDKGDQNIREEYYINHIHSRNIFAPSIISTYIYDKFAKINGHLDGHHIREVSYNSEDDNYYYNYKISFKEYYRNNGTRYSKKDFEHQVKLNKRSLILNNIKDGK